MYRPSLTDAPLHERRVHSALEAPRFVFVRFSFLVVASSPLTEKIVRPRPAECVFPKQKTRSRVRRKEEWTRRRWMMKRRAASSKPVLDFWSLSASRASILYNNCVRNVVSDVARRDLCDLSSSYFFPRPTREEYFSPWSSLAPPSLSLSLVPSTKSPCWWSATAKRHASSDHFAFYLLARNRSSGERGFSIFSPRVEIDDHPMTTNRSMHR